MGQSAYVEFEPDPALTGAIVCEWERTAASSVDLLVLPDGCVDIVWRSDGSLFVAGPDRGPVKHRQAPGMAFVGMRIRSGAAATVLGSAADELCDQRVPLSALWGSSAIELAERLSEATTLARRRKILAHALSRRTADASLDVQVLAAVRALAVPQVRVTDLAEHVELSARQLRRRFVQQVGYGPKVYKRVMRFRRFLALTAGTRPRRGLAASAAEAGFADQAHLTRECRRLTGRTPAQLVGSLGDGGAAAMVGDRIVQDRS